jgi:curved DNA-binding protein CbpA
VQGSLNEKPIARVIRLIAQKGMSGLLRVTRGKTIKAIFFEAGNPVFAISNVAAEQLEHKLLQDQIVTTAQLENARNHTDKANRLGIALVELGVLSQENLQKAVRRQVMDIIVSLFEWQEGEYAFDDNMRASHEIKLDANVTDILLEGARLAAQKTDVADLIAPPEGVVVRAAINQKRLDSGNLSPVESYVLSRIDMPTTINKIGLISGLPDSEAHRAVCALITSGFLKLVDENGRDEDDTTADSFDEGLEQFKEEIARKMHFYPHADYYEILEITRQATTSEIKAAYYQLAKKYHPDRFHQPEHADLRQKLESMFTLISQAYDTLSHNSSRTVYDQRPRREHSGTLTPPVVSAPAAIPTTKPLPPSITKPKVTTGNLKTNGDDSTKPSNSGNTTPPTPKAIEETTKEHAFATSLPSITGGAHSADYYFQQGRARLQHMDVHSAIHLLREAVKMEPNKAPYHFHLATALLRSPRNRREAEDHFAKAALLDPFNVQLRVKIGLLFKEAGNKQRSEQYFKEALSLDPDNRIAQKELNGGAKKPGDEVPIWKRDVGSIAKRLFKKS